MSPSQNEPTRDPDARSSGAQGETAMDRQSLLDRLREANEQLVVGSMRAQELAEQAEAARADAEAANRLTQFSDGRICSVAANSIPSGRSTRSGRSSGTDGC
jgi:hypothetical protein